MEHHITQIVHHMAKSQRELARILEAKRDMVVHAARLTNSIPNEAPVTTEADLKETAEQSLAVNKNLVSYLNALASLEEALSDNLGIVVRELNANGDE
ncbi:nucleoside-diphosphate sugar epimerase [Gorillibacterium sp. sgz5001074]|uniref:nucleoside-diphosphate sugar epimerase n=1 Tax=Gorillibacterium sp. sgz5001074 TaxID=3446695 RepID=UPI003F671886